MTRMNIGIKTKLQKEMGKQNIYWKVTNHARKEIQNKNK